MNMPGASANKGFWESEEGYLLGFLPLKNFPEAWLYIALFLVQTFRFVVFEVLGKYSDTLEYFSKPANL